MNSTGRQARGQESCSPASASLPPLPFFLLPPALCLFLFSPSMLFVLGTYQPERKKRSGGGGVSQHVRVERREKGENSMRSRDRESRLSTEDWKEEGFFLIWSHYSLLFIKSCVKVLLDASCHKRKPTRGKQQEKGQGITMVEWRRRK